LPGRGCPRPSGWSSSSHDRGGRCGRGHGRLPDLAGLHDYVGALGPAAPGVFVLLYAAATLAPLPKT